MSHQGNRMKCPHCDSKCTTIKTRQDSPTEKEVTYLCQNEECGHQFAAQISVFKEIEASRIPRPDIHYPVKARWRRSSSPPVPADTCNSEPIS